MIKGNDILDEIQVPWQYAKGVSDFQPRVARGSALPWVSSKKRTGNPVRVAKV